MKVTLAIILASLLLSSCCLVSSLECFCKPDEPYLVEATKDWIAPLQSEDIVFVRQDMPSEEQTLIKNYYEGADCVGGDECCSNFPIHEANLSFDAKRDNTSLFYTKAIAEQVEFL